MWRLSALSSALVWFIIAGLWLTACAPAAPPTPTALPAKATPVLPKPSPTAPLATPAVGMPMPTPTMTEMRLATPVPQPTAPGAPKRGGILKIGGPNEPEFADFNRISHIGGLMTFSDIHRGLIQVSPEDRSSLIPDLAVKWEAKDGGKVWLFTMRDGVVDQDGIPFTAEDAAYNINRWLTRPNRIPLPRTGAMRGAVEKAEAVDAKTLKITLKGATAAFLPMMSQAYHLMQPKRVLEPIDTEGKGRDLKAEEIRGVGPYKLKRWDRASVFTVERNPRYWEIDPKGKPYLDGIQNYWIADMTTLIAAFRARQIHMSCRFSTPTKRDVDDMKKAMGDKLVNFEVVAPGWRGLHFNLAKPPFSDVRLRRAINLAMDRKELNETFYDGAGKIPGPYLWAWDWLISEKEYLTWPGFRQDKKAEDIAEAKRLMREAGYSEKNPLKTSINTYTTGVQVQESQLLRERFRQIYVDMDMRQIELVASWEILYKGDFDMANVSTGIEFDDPESYHGTLWLPHAGRNVGKWENAEWMKLYEQQLVEFDRAKRAALLRKMAQIWWEDMPGAATLRPALNQVQWNFVKGYVLPIFHQANYRNDGLWLDL